LPYRQRYDRHRPCCSKGNGEREPNRYGAAMWRQRIVIGRPKEDCRRIHRQDFAGRRHLHMFHLAFSSGENTRRRRFTQSRARNHADLSLAAFKTRLSSRPAIEHILVAIADSSASPDVRAPGLLFPA
jgi:hypothetical protein